MKYACETIRNSAWLYGIGAAGSSETILFDGQKELLIGGGHNALLQSFWMAIMALEITLKISENKIAGISVFTLLYLRFIKYYRFIFSDRRYLEFILYKNTFKKIISIAFLLLL